MNKEKFAFIKQILKFISLWTNILIFVIILVISIFIYRNSILVNNLGNYTWIYSASMQTLAALIALLPISYGYYLRSIENEKSEEFDTYILKKLEKDVYYEMMFVIFFSLLAIVINLFNLFLEFHVVFVSISTFLTLISIQFVVVYIYRLFDPDRVMDILKSFDIKKKIDPNQKTVTLDEFITQYLNLETEVKDFISNENDNSLVDELPLYDIVDKLSKDFPLLKEHHQEFQEIIFHRNNLIHNYIETIVDYSRYAKIKELIALFSKNNLQFISENIFNNVLSVKGIIEDALEEYLKDYRTSQQDSASQSTTYEETLSALFQSHFINDYYDTLDFDEAAESDFEIIQNNFSNRRIVGIELKMTDSKSFKVFSKAFFQRMKQRYLYLFILNYNVESSSFEIEYMTKDKKIKYDVFK